MRGRRTTELIARDRAAASRAAPLPSVSPAAASAPTRAAEAAARTASCTASRTSAAAIDPSVLTAFVILWAAIVPTPGANSLMVTHVALTRGPLHVALR